MRTKEQMYTDIRDWEMDAGEDFLDYFGANMNEFNFMFWCLGKGYINEEQLQTYELKKYTGTEYLLGDETYSVVRDDEGDYDDCLEKAYKILADFLTSTTTYQIRVDEFLRDVTRLSFEDALKYRFRDVIFYELNGEKVYLKTDTPLTVDIITKAKWYSDNNYYTKEK